jgi:hypothetical protein
VLLGTAALQPALVAALGLLVAGQLGQLVADHGGQQLEQLLGTVQLVLPGGEPSPSRQVSAREMLAQVQQRLSAEERQLLELRQEGQDWAAIAAVVGGSPEARRKQLARAVERVAAELGLEECDND